MIVMKFGGAALADPASVRACADLVEASLSRAPVVVVSACGDTTDALTRLAHAALGGVADLASLRKYHAGLLADLELPGDLLDRPLHLLAETLSGVGLLRELTPRVMDRILACGERLSARLFAALLERRGVVAEAADADTLGLLTDSEHGGATPRGGMEPGLALAVGRLSGTPVVTGFIGRDGAGNVTTLGRGGSDYTASLLGAALGAEEVQVWKDVDGIMTCDPSLDARARNIPRFSFAEAGELAYYGAEVLHPNTLLPAIARNIPVAVRNMRRPTEPGTLITAEPHLTRRCAKSVVYKEGVDLISLESPRLMSAVQLLSDAFGVLRRHRVGVHMATTSEATVSMVTDRRYAAPIMDRALEELAGLGRVELTPGRALVCLVGEEMGLRRDLLPQVFAALAEKGISTGMISRTASRINLALLVGEDEIARAVTALHELLLASGPEVSDG